MIELKITNKHGAAKEADIRAFIPEKTDTVEIKSPEIPLTGNEFTRLLKKGVQPSRAAGKQFGPEES